MRWAAPRAPRLYPRILVRVMPHRGIVPPMRLEPLPFVSLVKGDGWTEAHPWLFGGSSVQANIWRWRR